MQLIRGLPTLPACALTIGNFDGVHLGHQAVLRQLREKANQLNLPMAVMLFEPQPQEYFQPNQAPARLMRLRDKLKALRNLGVDYVICQRFDRHFAEQSAVDFIKVFLVQHLNVKFLSIGDDFRFGAGRTGDFALLQQAGKEYGFEVEDNRSFCLEQQRISSTAIRQALATDNLAQTKALLDKDYAICGKVIHGNKLGRTIGFPTANILLHRLVVPIQGVYAVQVETKLGNFKGIANIGNRPTIGGTKPLLEVHLFDFAGDLYGSQMQVSFLKKVRAETKFNSFEELKQQIAKDVAEVKDYFASNFFQAKEDNQ